VASRWSPLLSGDAARQAREAVDAIAACSPGWSEDDRRSPLASGPAGASLLDAYRAAAGWGAADVAAGLDAAVDDLAVLTMTPSLFQGFTGTAWVHAHLMGRFLGGDAPDDRAGIDTALVDAIAASGGAAGHDLISGFTGLGVYALERDVDAAGDALVASVIAALAAGAEPAREGGVAWRTPAAMLNDVAAVQHPHGVLDLGMAHGAGGVIGFLAAACVDGACGAAGPLLDAAMTWLVAQAQSGGSSMFPAWHGDGPQPGHTRLAWCYGDTGLACALLAAGRARRRPDWEATAIHAARHAASRSFESSLVVDAGLCHGAAGLGHLFNRLWQATGEPELRDAAGRWFARTLAMRGAGGCGGYLAFEAGRGDAGRYTDHGFLGGGIGIALALLAAATDVAPDWDRVLLTSLDPA
jgi:hypothetical protein